MKFNSYEEYLEHAKAYFANKKELTIPVENMLLDKEMFELFNGSIKFGVSSQPSQSSQCCKNGECICKKENIETPNE